jgi:uncharacterized beta-barrel protein YwiB (DUF1934 family)
MSNKDKVRLRITSVNGEDPDIRQEFEAERYIKEKAVYLRYTETSAETGNTVTTLKISPGEIKIIRHGDIESEMTFAPGGRRSGFYAAPQGKLQLETETDPWTGGLADGSGAVSWQYRLTVSGEPAGRFRIRLDVE